MRAYQAVFFIEIVQKVFQGKPEKRLARLEEQLAERQEEIDEIKERIARVREEIARREKKPALASNPVEPGESRGGDETLSIVDRGSETVGLPHGKPLADDAAAGPSSNRTDA